jgi:hypothetical protein
MIHGEHSYKATLAALEELKSALKGLGASPDVNLAHIEHLRRQIKDMELELAEYEHHTQISIDNTQEGE